MPPEVDLPEIRAYLLGTLDDGRANALETAYFADPGLSDEVRAVEETLIDDYLAATLSPEDRTAFERHYLATPGHQQRLATARVLRARVGERTQPPVLAFQPSRRSRWVPATSQGWLAVAAALVVLALGSLWIASRGGAPPVRQAQDDPADRVPIAPPVQPPPGPSPVPAPESPDGAAPGAPAKPAPSTDRPRSLLALTLSPIVTRGDRQKAERLPEGPTDLLIHLEGTPDSADRTYVVELQTVEGRVVWQGRAGPATAGSGRLASVRVPADRLDPDDYVVAIFAADGGDRVERGRYALRLVPR